MPSETDRPDEGFGLLALGSSGRWDVSVDERLDRDEWYLELDGPTTYLTFRLRDLHVPGEALRFLATPTETELSLGWFGTSAVSLMWDDEVPTRCFLIVGTAADATLRLTLGADDSQMIRDALRQVIADLPPDE